MKQVRVINMTRLFSKEMLIYSFFDIRLKKPARVVWILYFILLCAIWTAPILSIFSLNPYSLALALVVPIAGASAMSKPIWGGKKFFSFLTCQIKYIFEPKRYYDTIKKPAKLYTYNSDYDVLVSRKKDYQKLLNLEKSLKGG